MTLRIPMIDYTMEAVGNEWIFTPKDIPPTTDIPAGGRCFASFHRILEEELDGLMTYSTILKCCLKLGDQIISEDDQYQTILKKLWSAIPLENVHEHSTYTFYTKEYNDALPKKKRLNRYEPLNLYFHSKDSNGVMKEIVHMVKLHGMTLHLEFRINMEGRHIRCFKC